MLLAEVLQIEGEVVAPIWETAPDTAFAIMGENRLISLAVLMRQYKLDDLALVLTRLTSLCRDLSTSDQISQPIATPEQVTGLGAVLEALYICCMNFDADPSLLSQMRDFQQEIVRGSVDRREAVLHVRLKAILAGVENNLGCRKFMYVPVEQAPYWDNFFWFGNEFLLAFGHLPKREMAELGSCITAGRWTACVFHSMRLAEYGLRKIAKTMRVTIVDKGTIRPIEYADWNKVITEIRNKITKVRTLPIGPQKTKDLEFYSRAADHCEYMKDIWRNEVSHTRKMYNKNEAFGVIDRVKEFMILLSEHYAQKQRKNGLRKLRAHGAGTPEGSA
jgi:hypothetical protein